MLLKMPVVSVNAYGLCRSLPCRLFLRRERICWLFIPDECIDCGVSEPECPAEAITDDSDDASKKWVEINRKYAQSLA